MAEEKEKDNEREIDEDKDDPSTPNTSGPKPHARTTPVHSAERMIIHASYAS